MWQRYSDLMSHEHFTDVGSYHSNRFKDKIKSYLGGDVHFVKPLSPTESILIFPSINDTAINVLKDVGSVKDDEMNLKSSSEMKKCDNELFSWLYRVAVKVNSDIRDCPGHQYIGGINLQNAESQVPESLYLFLSLLCGKTMEAAEEDRDKDGDFHMKILSIAQDILYLSTNGRKLTPKHIGLGLAVHQTTRSKELVQLLHAAGHSVSYDTVLRTDTAIAEDVLSCYNKEGDVFVPRNFNEVITLPNYIRYANDNIDIIEETLDGKGTFHASQTAAFRTSGQHHDQQRHISIETCRSRSFIVPDGYHSTTHIDMGNKKPECMFLETPKLDWFVPNPILTERANSVDLVWIISRQQNTEEQYIPSWTGFNEVITNVGNSKSTVGHLPIINATAHDFSTIWTVINR